MERIPTFWTLMEKSTITSGVIAIMVVVIMREANRRMDRIENGHK